MQQKDVSVLRKEEPGMNVAVNVSSQQNLAGGADANAALEREEDGEDAKGPRKDRRKQKKKKRREVESTSSSDGEDTDDDADRSKSKKKATAGVTTRINIFTGNQGPPGIGMQSGLTGPNLLSNISAPMPMIQPMPPIMQQVPASTKKQGSKRSSKSSKSKSSQGEARQAAAGAPAVIPPAMAGLMSGPDGQDVLVIPMPPGMKLPPFDATGGGLDQLFGAGFPFTDAQKEQQPKKNKKSIDASEVVRRSSSKTAVKPQSMQSIAGIGYPAEGAVAGVGAVVGEEGRAAGQDMPEPEIQRTDVEPPASENQAIQHDQPSSTAPSTGAGDHMAGGKSMTSEDDTNTMALLIFAAVVGIIVIVVIVFIVATASSSPGTSVAATTQTPDMSATAVAPPNPVSNENQPPAMKRRRRVGRRHPRPHVGYMSQLRRFHRPVQPYWNIK